MICLVAVRQKKKKIPLSTLEEVDMDLCDTEWVADHSFNISMQLTA